MLEAELLFPRTDQLGQEQDHSRPKQTAPHQDWISVGPFEKALGAEEGEGGRDGRNDEPEDHLPFLDPFLLPQTEKQAHQTVSKIEDYTQESAKVQDQFEGDVLLSPGTRFPHSQGVL
jgi:hypothetical protein